MGQIQWRHVKGKFTFLANYTYFQHHKHFEGSESIALTLIITGSVVKNRKMRNVSQPFKFVMEDKIARFVIILYSKSSNFGTMLIEQGTVNHIGFQKTFWLNMSSVLCFQLLCKLT